MAVGAGFGATNTILASLATRKHEVGALLAIGYLPRHLMFGILLESALLGLFGGVAGVLLSLPVNGWATGTLNWTTFTEQTFAFRVTPGVMTFGIVFSVFIGILGGLLPAMRARGLRPVNALRDV
jgi:putative ABC transport system permease protein